MLWIAILSLAALDAQAQTLRERILAAEDARVATEEAIAPIDHDYTVFGEVTAGMDVVDAVLEGDAIARVELQ